MPSLLTIVSNARPMRAASLALGAMLLASCQDSPTGPGAARPGLAPPLSASGESRADRAFSFTTIDFPNARSTGAWGINAGGDIVGGYVDAAGRGHGYVLRRGEFTTIDYPGSEFTEARGISPNGEIVGVYRLVGEPASRVHGFLLTKHGEFVKMDSPGHINTIAQRVLPDGTVLGCRHDNDTMGSMKGITINREGYSEITAFASMNNGATPNGRHIVGLYTNEMMQVRGYRIDVGVFTQLHFPNSTFTAAWDINPRGEIVGVYILAGTHGFVLRGDDWVTIDVPGASVTRAWGINSRGDVVGNYTDATGTHGYLASL